MRDCSLWCTQCGKRVAEKDGLRECPECGTKSIPCDPVNDVAIEINWHELRILGIWASNWANEKCKDDIGSAKSLHAILTRIHRQHPTKDPLTLFGEIAALRKEYDVTTNKPLQTEVVPVYGGGAIGHTELTATRQRIAELEAERRWIPTTELLPTAYKPLEVIDTDGHLTGAYMTYGHRFQTPDGRHIDVSYWREVGELPPAPGEGE